MSPPAMSHPDIAARYSGPIPGDSVYTRALGIEGHVTPHLSGPGPTRVTSTRGSDKLSTTAHYGSHFPSYSPSRSRSRSRSRSPPRWRSTPPPHGVSAAVRRVPAGGGGYVVSKPYDMGIAMYPGGFALPVPPTTGGLIFPGGFGMM